MKLTNYCPATWGERFPTCDRGSHQSPININEDECSVDVALPSLSWHDVSRPRALQLKNTWHSVNDQYVGAGPATWGERFTTCDRGTHQSPININEDECSVDVALPSLSWHDLSRPRALQLKNTWHSVSRTLLRGGPLKRDYVLSQIHFHWGRGDRGSEHALNKRFFQMEVHMVHYNTKFTGGIEEASRHPSGLAVVAYFLKGNATVDLAPSALDWLWRGLDPSTYFTYRGSLTTPPCTEGVVWFVLKRHGHVGISQEALLHVVKSYDDPISWYSSVS
ncbi:hypothetical protein B566_EDAN010935, partial [Ephemera danica]